VPIFVCVCKCADESRFSNPFRGAILGLTGQVSGRRRRAIESGSRYRDVVCMHRSAAAHGKPWPARLRVPRSQRAVGPARRRVRGVPAGGACARIRQSGRNRAKTANAMGRCIAGRVGTCNGRQHRVTGLAASQGRRHREGRRSRLLEAVALTGARRVLQGQQAPGRQRASRAGGLRRRTVPAIRQPALAGSATGGAPLCAAGRSPCVETSSDARVLDYPKQGVT